VTHKLRIEMDRGNGWELRSEGEVPNDATIELITVYLRNYAIQHPHRAVLDGVVVATTQQVCRLHC
jgi:hypothetical protein